MVGAPLVGRVAQELVDIMHEERIQKLSDLLLVGEVQSALVRDPTAAGLTSCSR